MKKEHSPKCDVVKYPTIAQACTCHKHPPVAPAPTASAREWPYEAVETVIGDWYVRINDPIDDPGPIARNLTRENAELIRDALNASSQSSKLEGLGQEVAEKLSIVPRRQAEIASVIDELIAGRLPCK